MPNRFSPIRSFAIERDKTISFISELDRLIARQRELRDELERLLQEAESGAPVTTDPCTALQIMLELRRIAERLRYLGVFYFRDDGGGGGGEGGF